MIGSGQNLCENVKGKLSTDVYTTLPMIVYKNKTF